VSLFLTIISYHKITPGQVSEISLETGVMAIGRGPDNDWVLPDPERLVSSRHCLIQYREGHYCITDNSTNGVELVNTGLRLRRGNSEALQDGEIIRIGDYEIQVRIYFEMRQLATELHNDDSFDSFEALMGRPGRAVPSASATAHLPDGKTQDTFPDLFDFLAPSSVPPATRSDHVPAESHDFRPPTPLARHAPGDQPRQGFASGVIPEDWDLLADMPKAQAPSPAVQPDPAPVTHSAPVVTVENPYVDEPHALASTEQNPDLLKAFMRGAALGHVRIDSAHAEAQMESIGRSYRLMVEGLIDVLRARSSLKGEFRLQQTMIQPMENNPLKFAPNADEGLLLLLRHGNQAFMPPDEAIADSFNDLRAHQLAVMAGVEAAIKALLKRFEPAALEARMGKPGALSTLFGSRQAQRWQQFTELYTQISRETEDDFQVLFGREFSRAYEEHSARLRRP
jgi:type VI secretion system protein